MPQRTFFSIFLAFCSVFGLLFSSLDAAAQIKMKAGSGFTLQNADSFYRDNDRKLIVLQGNVIISYGDQTVSCDKATIFESTKEIEAEGNLVINSPTAYVAGDRARFNYETGNGVVYNGLVRSGQVVFEGRIVRKIGPQEYEADSAYYTACETCPPAWSFTGSKIQAQLGGYAFIRNSVLEISHFPVFWLPYIVVPLKSDRQTGFLIPGLEFTSGGTALYQSFFWANSRSTDSTWTLKNYSFRGLKGLVNYRYVQTDTSGGEMNAGLIQDKVFVSEDSYLAQPNREPVFNRWFFRFENLYELPSGFVQKSNFNFVSDLYYARDFEREVPGYGSPALENRFSLTKNTQNTHSSLDVSHYTNNLKSDPIAQNFDSVHRFPELRYSIVDQMFDQSGFVFRLDTNYVNYAREDYAYDDVWLNGTNRELDTTRTQVGGGQFNEDLDVIRTGQRFDFTPEISRPFMIGEMIDILPYLNFRHTQYAFDVSPSTGSTFQTSPYRQYVGGNIAARMRFSGIYGIDETDPKDRRIKHEIEPEIAVSSFSLIHESEHSFFGGQSQLPVFRINEPMSNSDFASGRGIQFDYRDRPPIRKLVTFGLTNRLIEKTWEGENPKYQEIVDFRLQQSYDIDEARKDTDPKYPWSDISALLEARTRHFETLTSVNYYPYHNATNTFTRLRGKDSLGNFLEVRFSQKYRITENLSEDYTNRDENLGFGAGITHKYLNLAGGIDYQPTHFPRALGQPFSSVVKSWTADLMLKPPGNCWSVRTLIRQKINTEPEFSLEFGFLFGGEGTANVF